jgi:uncharacterized membrane protein
MTLRVAGHPLHPMLVHFPVALWTLAVAADAGGVITRHETPWSVSFACQALGLLAALPAMAAGVLDFASVPRGHPARDTAIAHLMAMGTAWLSFLASAALRGLPGQEAPPAAAILAGIAGFLAMAVGGWLGGRLVYRFGVGVNAEAAQELSGHQPRVD